MCVQTLEHEVRSTSTFLAGDRTVDSRKIGTEHWPLKLNVQFYESTSDDYYAKACILTERTGQVTCFMNSTYSKAELLAECSTDRLGALVSSSVPMFLLTVLMILLFLTIGVGIVFLAHHLFMRIARARRSSRKFHKQMDKRVIRGIYLYEFKLGTTAKEADEKINAAFGQGCSTIRTAYRWYQKFGMAMRAWKNMKSQCTALLPSIHTQKISIEDDRLTVIEEEKEESSRISPSPSSSGFESDMKGFSFNSCDTRSTLNPHDTSAEPVQTVAKQPFSVLQTFRPAPHPL
ncbi:unnamed protein product [Heligmosomoides polygyrus]|uniref:HTH_48 domain-containing protein n=1 Tax=Heligmosomoides polygyrus TaxID=6339 RepID=A0A3P8AXF6_HELPZ|nr:unnamed protein product [Heligmosomoides polygyrus]